MSPVMNLAFGIDTVLFHNIFDVVKSAVWVPTWPGIVSKVVSNNESGVFWFTLLWLIVTNKSCTIADHQGWCQIISVPLTRLLTPCRRHPNSFAADLVQPALVSRFVIILIQHFIPCGWVHNCIRKWDIDRSTWTYWLLVLHLVALLLLFPLA